MVRFQPSLGGNDRRLQSQIQRIAGAPLGPIDIRPGEGYVTFYDGDGNVIAGMNQSGVKVRYRGGTNDVSEVLAVKTDYSYVDGNVRTLQADINTRATRVYVDGNIKTLVEKNAAQDAVIDTKAARTYVDGNIKTLVEKNADQDADIATRATRTYVDGNISTLVSKNNSQDARMDRMDSEIDTKASRSYVDGNVTTLSGRISSAQSTADNALSTARSIGWTVVGMQAAIGTLADKVGWDGWNPGPNPWM